MTDKLKFLTKMSLNKKIKTKWFLIANLIFAILIIGLLNIDSIIKFFGGDFEAFRQVCTANGIKDVKVNDVVEFAGLKFFLTHEPKDHKNGFVNLCGHLHRSRGTWYSFGLNMSCDLNNFMPYSESDILFQLSQRDKYYNSDENFKII
jgi:calcineurin-like phosphoesterase family protein